MSQQLSSGWGIRSLAEGEAAYNPLGYHLGTVWPHDTAIAAEGMRRYGFAEEAGRVVHALLDAAEAFRYQLPEVFAGFRRDETNLPVEYPGALVPQAWSAAAPLLGLRTLLGLEAVDGRLVSAGRLPPGLGALRLKGIRVGGRSFDAPGS